MHLYMHIVTSNDPIHMSFPNKFPLGNPENEPCKLEIHFDDLLVEKTKVMKLLKEMIELHNHVFELQMLANGLSTLKLQAPVIHF